jgi:hypothetical protein
MHRIRTLTVDDIPQLASLYQKTFGEGAQLPFEPLAHYFHEVFFENPWSDRTLPSLVYEMDQRTIVGFLGVIPRRFNLRGRSIKVAVSAQFMVEKTSRSLLVAPQLLQRYFAGAQELSFTDGANDSSRRTWKALGGLEVPVYSICWTRQLRRPRGRESADEGRSADWSDADRAVADLTEDELDIPTILDNLPRLAGTVLMRSEYDQSLLQWLFHLAEQKRKHGPLRKRVLRKAGRVEGWYVYYLNVGGTSQVLQLMSAPQSFTAVLTHLFSSAWREGSAAVAGRLEPQHLHDFSRAGCQFSAGSAVLAHALDFRLLEPIYTGDAVLSRLDGEWWNRFIEFIPQPRQPAHGQATTHQFSAILP